MSAGRATLVTVIILMSFITMSTFIASVYDSTQTEPCPDGYGISQTATPYKTKPYNNVIAQNTIL